MTTTASVSATIRNHPEALAASDTFAEFCDKLGHTWIKDIEWAARVFETIKFNSHCDGSYKPLYLPKARTFSDIFEAARFTKSGERLEGFHFLGATNAKGAAYSGHLGGLRYVRLFRDGTACRGHGRGVEYYSTYVRPRPEVFDLVEPGMIDKLGSFEVITRADGTILVTARDALGIGERWLAVLNAGTKIDDIMAAEDLAFLKAEYAAQEADWACIYKGEDGREYLDESKCRIEIRRD